MKPTQKLKIKNLQVRLEKIAADAQAASIPVRQALEAEFDALYDAGAALKAAIEALEASTAYAFNEIGDLTRWVRIDVSAHAQGDVAQLERYLSAEGIQLDIENQCIMLFEGDFIAIDEEGDVAVNESGRWTTIAARDAYESVDERNALIEAWMHEKGFYPSVIRIDRYGNAVPVSTQPRTQSA